VPLPVLVSKSKNPLKKRLNDLKNECLSLKKSNLNTGKKKTLPKHTNKEEKRGKKTKRNKIPAVVHRLES
tara:strand:- start:2146 stop:2355 length:210 start_codon:yes stop_codon:yes gene_type:complete